MYRTVIYLFVFPVFLWPEGTMGSVFTTFVCQSSRLENMAHHQYKVTMNKMTIMASLWRFTHTILSIIYGEKVPGRSRHGYAKW